MYFLEISLAGVQYKVSVCLHTSSRHISFVLQAGVARIAGCLVLFVDHEVNAKPICVDV